MQILNSRHFCELLIVHLSARWKPGILDSTYLKSDSFAKCLQWSYFLGVALLFSLSPRDKTLGAICTDGTVASHLFPVSCLEGPVYVGGGKRGGSHHPSALCLLPGLVPLLPIPLLVMTYFYNDQVWLISLEFSNITKGSPLLPNLVQAMTTFKTLCIPYFCFTFPAHFDGSLSLGTPHNSVSLICWFPECFPDIILGFSMIIFSFLNFKFYFLNIFLKPSRKDFPTALTTL